MSKLPADEIKIRQIRPVSRGVGMPNHGDLVKVLTARREGYPGYDSGYDITLVRPRRAFRIDHYNDGERYLTRWVTESRVECYDEWE